MKINVLIAYYLLLLKPRIKSLSICFSFFLHYGLIYKLISLLLFYLVQNNSTFLYKFVPLHKLEASIKIKKYSRLGTFTRIGAKFQIKRLQHALKHNYKLILRLTRKNLFLTFLNKNKNVVLKTNLGACGFKKKVKFTGFALEETCINFGAKIDRFLVELAAGKEIAIWAQIMKFKTFYKKYIITGIHRTLNSAQYSAKTFYIVNWLPATFWRKSIAHRQQRITHELALSSFSKIFETKMMSRIIHNYRHYLSCMLDTFTEDLKDNNYLLTLTIKNNLKFWPFRYIMKGLSKHEFTVDTIESRIPIPHSLGFRLKKKRRV